MDQNMVHKKICLYIYYFVIFVLSLLSFYLFYYVTRNQSSDYMYTEKCVLCVISSFFNIFVLYYHLTTAPHPKFIILLRRRFVIYIHIISGTIEFVACWAAFLTGNAYIGTVAALAAILGHVPSAYYQTSIVFGAKALIVAAYLFAISLHLFCAMQLFLTPTSVYWLLNMFLVYNIYVWCRVFYFFFVSTGLFKDSRYTNSTLTSGLLLLPAVLGASANVVFLGFIGVSIILYFVIVQPTEKDRALFINECSRDLLVNKTVHNAWIKDRERLSKLAKTENLTDQQRAKQVFDDIDKNKNGTIDSEEMIYLLKDWKAASGFIQRFSRWSKNQDISFELFYRHIWRLGETSLDHVEKGIKREEKEKARFVFDHLDVDKSGFIDGFELENLLIQWGLPENEVEAYLAEDEDKRFSFEEFYQNLKPIWNFAYHHMCVGENVQPSSDHVD